jgi:hypothetical protein
MRIRTPLSIDRVRFRTEISIGFWRQTAKFFAQSKLNREPILLLAWGPEGVAGDVE